ncbi:saccharopine dehydrogenase, partial [Enterococcus hirae]
MKGIITFGAGKIGVVLAHILADAGDYTVTLVDECLEPARKHFGDRLPSNLNLEEYDVNDEDGLAQLIK